MRTMCFAAFRPAWPHSSCQPQGIIDKKNYNLKRINKGHCFPGRHRFSIPWTSNQCGVVGIQVAFVWVWFNRRISWVQWFAPAEPMQAGGSTVPEAQPADGDATSIPNDWVPTNQQRTWVKSAKNRPNFVKWWNVNVQELTIVWLKLGLNNLVCTEGRLICSIHM